MENLLQKVILNNTLQQYLEVFLTVLVAFIVKRFVSKYLAGLLYRLFTKAGKTLHKENFLNLIISPLEIFLFLFIFIFAFDKLTLPAFLRFKVFRDIDFKTVLQAVTDGALIITFIRLCIRFVKFVALILEEKSTHNDRDNTNQLIVFF
ncbi:MAG TPA: hypothetical protein VHB48_07495, partial [Chitinophagaceae bacterium]|nr:hypothetical protein [Chitinophagaceae bacterium]